MYDDAGNLALRWSDRILHDSNQMGALDWNYRTLYDSGLHIVADWERKQLFDTNTIPAVDWGSRILYDSQSNESLNWFLRQLRGDWSVVAGCGCTGYGSLSVAGGVTVQDGCAGITLGCTNLSESQLTTLLAFPQAIDAANYQLLSRSSNPTVKWADR